VPVALPGVLETHEKRSEDGEIVYGHGHGHAYVE
jgi:hypothetical protein